MPNKLLQQAVKQGIISKKQLDKMPKKMLLGLVKSKKRRKPRKTRRKK